VSQFSHLTSINFSGNAITFIPQSVQDLQGLQQLLVSRNNLGSLPPEIGMLTALTELDVGSNSIRKLPDALCKLTGLKARARSGLIPSVLRTCMQQACSRTAVRFAPLKLRMAMGRVLVNTNTAAHTHYDIRQLFE
jgi:hypothetical protein